MIVIIVVVIVVVVVVVVPVVVVVVANFVQRFGPGCDRQLSDDGDTKSLGSIFCSSLISQLTSALHICLLILVILNKLNS